MIQMQNKLHKVINELGLTSNESAVYLAALSLGPTTVMNIAKFSEVERANVYRVIESLELKGLMVVTIDGFKKKYEAADPSHLERLLEERRKEFSAVLPELKSLYNTGGGVSEIKFFRGVNGLKGVYEDILKELKSSDFYYVISNLDAWYSIDSDFLERFVQKRIKNNLRVKMLLQDNEKAQENKKFQTNFLQEVEILPHDTKLETDTIITPKKVIIVQLKDPITTFVIENNSIVTAHKQYFETMWKLLKQ